MRTNGWRSLLGAALVWGVVGSLASPSAAQPTAESVPMSDEVVSRPSIGLTTTLPAGSTRSGYQFSGRAADKITFPGGMAAIVNLTQVYLKEARPLPEVADEIIREHLATVSSLDVKADKPVESERQLSTAKGRLLERKGREINGWPAEVLYIQLASVGGEDAVYGYALFMPTANTLAQFVLQTTVSNLPRARPYFEAMVNSTRIVDPGAAAAQRAMGIEAGTNFFQSLTPEDVESVIKRLGTDWRAERFYQPAVEGSGGDAVELGYRLTRYAVGTRADLKREGERGGTTPEDRQRGFLVFQKARILSGEQMFDVEAGYFVSPDRSQEMWTIRQAVKSSKKPDAPPTSIVTETGVRERADLTISRVSKGGPVQTIYPAIDGVGYVSRAEVLLMPYLLMHKDAPGEYRFYAFNQSTDRVTMRVDILEPPTATRGTWEYTSRPSETAAGQIATFNSRMELTGADGAEGERWEPMTVRELADLWKRKGLPIN